VQSELELAGDDTERPVFLQRDVGIDPHGAEHEAEVSDRQRSHEHLSADLNQSINRLFVGVKSNNKHTRAIKIQAGQQGFTCTLTAAAPVKHDTILYEMLFNVR